MIAVFWAGFVLTGIAVMLAYVHLDRPRETPTGCWPEPETDDDVTRCGACGTLWTATRVCPRSLR